VTQYLTDEDVRRTLAFVEKTEAGSLLIFTYVLRGIIERRVKGLLI
jgi:O-methyltransferase involved in polyketide biosynthesis